MPDSRQPLIVRSWLVVEAIIHHISGIKCAGEIRLAEHEDYDKWCIDIFVKFRDKEQLAQLTGQRQSGGVCLKRLFADIYADGVVGTCAEYDPLSYELGRACSCSILASR